MTLARVIAAVLVAAGAVIAWFFWSADSDSCVASGTAQNVLAVLEQTGEINYLNGESIGATAEPQFARATVEQAGPIEAGSYACRAVVAVDYNPGYIRRMLADKGQTLAAGESMHREFRLEFTPSRTGEDRNFVLRYRLERP